MTVEKIKAAALAAKNSLSHDPEYEQFDEIVTPSAVLELIARLEAAERDAERYRWLKKQIFSGDFDYHGECVVTFLWPKTVSLGMNFDACMNDAMKENP